jgi:integrase
LLRVEVFCVDCGDLLAQRSGHGVDKHFHAGHCDRIRLRRWLIRRRRGANDPHRFRLRRRAEMQTYTPDEITAVLRAADKDRSGHLWYLALSGLRRAELAGLQWSDIDLDGGTLTIARNRVQVGAATVVENEPKTQSSRRTLPLDPGLVTVLRRARSRHAQEKLVLGTDYADSGYVACNEAGEAYTPGALTNMWHRLTAAAGVRPIRLHDARHSCGTALHLRGVPLAVIAKWLGHADAAITARIYAHSQPDALKAAGATLGQLITPGQ